MIDLFSYLLAALKNYKRGYAKGYTDGEAVGKSIVEITGNITCTDDGEGNITITQGE